MSTDIAGYVSLGSEINKQRSDGTQDSVQGVVSEKLPELTLEMKDEELIKLTEKWEKDWKESPVRSEFEKNGDDNVKYWLGKHFDIPSDPEGAERPMVDNVIFESVETHLSQITRRNPEPLVALHSSELDESGNADEAKMRFVQKVKNFLADVSDENTLRLKLKGAGRHWELYLLGALKFGWDLDKNIPSASVIRPRKLILDKGGSVDEDGYHGKYLGEYRKLEAGRILKIIGEEEDQLGEDGSVSKRGNSEARKFIKESVKDDLATEIQFIEWWTPEYMCWTLGKHVLWKKRNPHWNYDRVEQVESVDEVGASAIVPQDVAGINHLPVPAIPYRLLSIYNLGEQPVDKTSLVGQNLSNQDRVNKRNKQVDKNADNMNGGIVVSLARSGLTQAQAKGVTSALAKGGAVLIPDGSPREAIDRYASPGLPPDIYNDLLDSRARLRDIFGTRGSSPAGIESEDTVRGKIISRGLDTDRIGGGISEYLEQLADGAYNWFLQLLYVYDDNFQFVGGGRPPRVTISVKEGSLLPKDSMSIANQALELAKLNRISNLDLYKRLEFPNPEEMAANVWLEANAPQLLYKDNPMVQEVIAGQQAAAAEASGLEARKGEEEHERGMEKEVVKGVMRNRPAEPRSLLAEVPQDVAGPAQ